MTTYVLVNMETSEILASGPSLKGVIQSVFPDAKFNDWYRDAEGRHTYWFNRRTAHAIREIKSEVRT